MVGGGPITCGPALTTDADEARYRALLARAWTVDYRGKTCAPRGGGRRVGPVVTRDDPSTGTEALAILGRARSVFALSRGRGVRVDREGIEVGRRRVAWREVEALDWYPGTVEVRRFDGRILRHGHLRLPEAEVARIEARCDALRLTAPVERQAADLRRRRPATAPADRPRPRGTLRTWPGRSRGPGRTRAARASPSSSRSSQPAAGAGRSRNPIQSERRWVSVASRSSVQRSVRDRAAREDLG